MTTKNIPEGQGNPIPTYYQKMPKNSDEYGILLLFASLLTRFYSDSKRTSLISALHCADRFQSEQKKCRYVEEWIRGEDSDCEEENGKAAFTDWELIILK